MIFSSLPVSVAQTQCCPPRLNTRTQGPPTSACALTLGSKRFVTREQANKQEVMALGWASDDKLVTKLGSSRVILRRCAPLHREADRAGGGGGGGSPFLSSKHSKPGVPKLKLPGSSSKSLGGGSVSADPFAWFGGVDSRGRKLA